LQVSLQGSFHDRPDLMPCLQHASSDKIGGNKRQSCPKPRHGVKLARVAQLLSW
jgi:hypothetical protein